MPTLRDIFNRSALKKGVDRDLSLSAESGSGLTPGTAFLIDPSLFNNNQDVTPFDTWAGTTKYQLPTDASAYLVTASLELSLYPDSNSAEPQLLLFRDEAHWDDWFDGDGIEPPVILAFSCGSSASANPPAAVTMTLIAAGGWFLVGKAFSGPPHGQVVRCNALPLG